jgi:type III pantothenate kinase
MLLVLDVGNTETTIGLFEGETLSKRWSVSTTLTRTQDEWAALIKNLFDMAGFSPSELDGIVISSVVPPVDPVLKSAFETYLSMEPLFVAPGIKTGIQILYENPTEVGADRVVNAVAVSKLYQLPAIVIDFGTATTFDLVAADGSYVGGVIAPGLAISAEALFTKAAKLPKVEIAKPKKVIGRSTISSIQSGLFYGYASLTEGIVKRIKNESGDIKSVIATGGLAKMIYPECPFIDEVDEDLTLKGLYFIYEKNRT